MLAYDYIEYQHIKIHLFISMGESDCDRVIPKLIKHTVRKYHDRVLDIFFDDVDHPVSRYLYNRNIRPRVVSCHKTYFRTRFHPMSDPVDAVVQEEAEMLMHDIPLYYVLQSIPPECRANALWLYRLLYQQPPSSFRNNPVRYILAYRAHVTSELRESLSLCLEKLKAFHFSSVSERHKIPMVMTVNPQGNYVSFCSRNVATAVGTPVLGPVAITSAASPLEDFVLETDPMNLSLDLELALDDVEEDCMSVTSTDRTLLVPKEPEPVVKNRCDVVIRTGSRKGEKCNRECKMGTVVCGIHNYSVEEK